MADVNKDQLPQLPTCPQKKKRFYQKLFRFHGKDGERSPSPSDAKAAPSPTAAAPDAAHSGRQLEDLKRVLQKNWRHLFHRSSKKDASRAGALSTAAPAASGSASTTASPDSGSSSMSMSASHPALEQVLEAVTAAPSVGVTPPAVIMACEAQVIPVVPPRLVASAEDASLTPTSTPSPMPSSSGDSQSFDERYHFCSNKIIGRGGSGVVRLARGLTGDTIYAVKEFRKRRKDESAREYLKKLTAEFCISSMLHHPHIVETYDIVRDGSHWYEIMEFCPGGDLFSVIRDGHLVPEDVDVVFKQLLLGVDYLHSIGVAHRDLKPENLLIDACGHLKITDFGVSEVFRVCWEKTPHRSKGLCGSAPYIAPEVLAGQEYDAAAADIWSCGIIYYAMTFHGIPWSLASPKDPNFRHYMRHRGVGFEPLVRLPHAAQVLMRRMLEPDPAARITIKEILEDAWISGLDVPEHGFDAMLHARTARLPPPRRRSTKQTPSPQPMH